MKRSLGILLALVLAFGLTGCAKTGSEASVDSEAPSAAGQADKGSTEGMHPSIEEVSGNQSLEGSKTKLLVNDVQVPVIWESCEAVEELAAEAADGDIVVSMSMYGGWEQVGSLDRSYTRDDRQMTAENGDIVLYDGNQIVLFYGSNSWPYTKLGKMDLSSEEVRGLLSNGDVVLTITRR